MIFYVFKVIITGFLIVLITEVTKINTKLGGILTAMPIITLLVLFWLYFEGASNEKMASYVKNTFYFIIPTLSMFLVFPILIQKYSFSVAIITSIFLIALLAFTIDYFYNIFEIEN
ncbi:MAG: hypothetical protein CMP24_06770 [Rickettsiales bacterium]|nr:hypothetical protein [Rickettsiales bacterium]|tara:strand:+ start:464 stop:811 length:348 start_codon:yes stop_codon:yes gene_type:complete